jgi:hypothetical protein
MDKLATKEILQVYIDRLNVMNAEVDRMQQSVDEMIADLNMRLTND